MEATRAIESRTKGGLRIPALLAPKKIAAAGLTMDNGQRRVALRVKIFILK